MCNRPFIFFILFAENFTYTERKAGQQSNVMDISLDMVIKKVL